jgi:hypothetical protein
MDARRGTHPRTRSAGDAAAPARLAPPRERMAARRSWQHAGPGTIYASAARVTETALCRLLVRVLSVPLLAAAAVALAGCAAERACPDLPTTIGAALAGEVDRIVDDAAGSGFAGGVAVIADGAVVYTRVAGFSDAARTVPVTGATLFHVASVTKYLTAALVLAAAEDAKLSLDDPLR